MRLAALAVVCALLVTSFPLALATNEVTMLGESAAAVAEEEGKPGGVSMPSITGGQYEQWAQEDQRVLSQFPPPPPEPKNRKQKAETLRWALMRGLKQDLVDAKRSKWLIDVRKQKQKVEESDREMMQSYIQQALLKVKTDKQIKDGERESSVSGDSTAGRRGNERQSKGSSQGRYSIGGSRNGTRTR